MRKYEKQRIYRDKLDSCDNYVVNDFGACQSENHDIDKEFNEIGEIMIKAK